MFFGWADIRQRLKHNWRLLFSIVVPLLVMPIAFLRDPVPHRFSNSTNSSVEHEDPNRKFRTAYVITLMALFWIFEVLPLAVTSLFPLVLFPFLRIQEACIVSRNYMKESNMIFLGAIIIALSIEYCGLHKRGALRVISIFGAKPPRIMLGTMIITGALSMWLSDTSCTTMILPILTALTTAMFREEQADTIAEGHDEDAEEDEQEPRRRTKRVSVVFANSAMQGHGRRKKKRSSQLNKGPTSQMSQMFLGGSQDTIATIQSRAAIPTINVGVSNPDENGKATGVSWGDSGEEESKAPMEAILEEGVVGNEDGGKAVSGEIKEVETPQAQQTHARPSCAGEDDEMIQTNVRKMLLFAVAYAANIGGTGSLVGTGPIKVFKELNKNYVNKDIKNTVNVSFATWMAFTMLPVVLNLGVVWFFLTMRYYGLRKFFRKTCPEHTKREREKVQHYLATEFERLGSITSHEIGVLVVFILVVVLWLTREPQIFHGWDYLISAKKSKTGDSTPAMFAAVLLFIFPKKWGFLNFKKPFKAGLKYEALLSWKFVSTNAPWGYVLLIGSGYAIADASEHSGLSDYIGWKLQQLSATMSDEALLLTVIVITTVMTEVVSNTACATLLLPTLFSLSCDMDVKLHPSYLTMAAAIAASYAFMLPISSPPNAIVFATGDISIREMIMNGFILNIFCTLILYLTYITYGEFIFEFSKHNHEYECQEVSLC